MKRSYASAATSKLIGAIYALARWLGAQTTALTLVESSIARIETDRLDEDGVPAGRRHCPRRLRGWPGTLERR